MFGAFKNYDGGPCESFHRYFGSQPAQNTQKRHDTSFEYQCCQRLTEKMVINTCNDVVDQYYKEVYSSDIQTDVGHSHSDVGNGTKFQGKQYTVYFRSQSVKRKTTTSTRTTDTYYEIEIKHKDEDKTSIFPKNVIVSLQNFCDRNHLRNGYFYVYTEVNIGDTLYRAHYEYHEGDSTWLSWCNIEWEKGSRSVCKCPGKIMLICDIHKISNHLRQNDLLTDSSNCMLLVQSTNGYHPIHDKKLVAGKVMPTLKQKEYSIFNLWDMDTQIRIISSSSISSPAYIIPNIRTKKKHRENDVGRYDSYTVIEVTDPMSWGKLFILSYKQY